MYATCSVCDLLIPVMGLAFQCGKIMNITEMTVGCKVYSTTAAQLHFTDKKSYSKNGPTPLAPTLSREDQIHFSRHTTHDMPHEWDITINHIFLDMFTCLAVM